MSYTADTLDVLTEEEAREAVGYRSQEQAGNLAAAVTAVSRLLDDHFGAVVQRTVTAEIQPGWRSWVTLKVCPVTSFTSVDEADGATVTALTRQTFGADESSTTYRAEAWQTSSAPFSGTICRTSGVFARDVRVTYVAGRYATTAAADRRFKQAAAIALKNIWKAYQDSLAATGEFSTPFSSFPTFGLPKACRELLRNEMLIPGIA